MSKRSFWIGMACLLLVGAALRAVHLRDMRSCPFLDHPAGDCKDYVARAKQIEAGDHWGRKPYFLSSPGYPYYLAFCFALFGPSLQVPLWVQAFAGLLTAGLLGLAARRLWGDLEGLIAALMAALYGPFLFFEGELLMASLTVLAVAGALFHLAHPRASTRSRLAAGGCFALACLGSPNLLLPIGVIQGWILLSVWRKGSRTLLPGALAVILPSLLIVAIVTFRNWIVLHEVMPFTSSMGVNFYIGNHPGATGSFSVPMELAGDLETRSKLLAEQERGRPLSASQVSAFWMKKGLRFPLQHPKEFLKLTARKVLLLLNRYEVPNVYDYEFFHRYSRALRGPLLQFSIIAPLGLAGLAMGRFRRFPLLPLFVFSGAVSILAFFITARYRAPLVPGLMLSAAWLVGDMLKRVRAGAGIRGISKDLAVLLGMAILVNAPRVPHAEPAEMWIRLGQAQAEMGDWQKARESFEQAIAKSPKNPEAWYRLGVLATQEGRVQESIPSFERAIAMEPRFTAALLGLAEAQDVSGLVQEAQASLQKALAIEPNSETVLWNLWKLRRRELSPMDILTLAQRDREEKGPRLSTLRAAAAALKDLKRYEETISVLNEALSLYPHEESVHLDLARTLLDMGHTQAAEAAARGLLNLSPFNGDGHNILGVIAAQREDLPTAIEEFSEACRLDPSNQNAKMNLERAKGIGTGK